jgi:DNA polymerase I-like protein with 3'-5' exonuclease and polymerase domains
MAEWTADKSRLVVTLTPEQKRAAAREGLKRHASQRNVGRGDWKSKPGDNGKKLDVQGAVAELAVSLGLGLPWDGAFKPISEWDTWRREGHDVSGLEVKSTIRQDGCLILHKHSNPDQPAVLALLEGEGRVVLAGWCFVRDGQSSQFWRDNVPRPCYMVPQSNLRPICELFQALGLDVDPSEETPVTDDEDLPLDLDDEPKPKAAVDDDMPSFEDDEDEEDLLGDFMDNMGLDVEGSGNDLSKPWMKFHEFRLVKKVEEVRKLIDECLEHGHCALDLETEGFDNRIEYDAQGNPYTRHKIVGYCIGLQGRGFYIPVRHRWERLYDSRGPNVDDVLGTEEEIKRLCLASQPVVDPEAAKYDPLGSKELVEPPKVIIKFWHAKFDQEFLYPVTGIDWWHPDSFEDGMLAAYTIYTDGIHGLKENSAGKPGAVGGLSVKDPEDPEVEHPYEMIKFSDLFPKGTKRKDQAFYKLSPSEDGEGWNCVLYGCSDGICTDLLCDQLVPKASSKKYKGFYRLEKQVVQAVRIMERVRVQLNKDEIIDLLAEAEQELETYERKIVNVAKEAGFETFNPASSSQLADLLFGEKHLDLPDKPEKTSQDQYKTDEKTLEVYLNKPGCPPVIEWIIKHRQINKVKGTYLENLANNTDELGQLRLNFKQSGAATGRFTAPKGDADHGFAGVPIQGIPAKNDPKKPQVAHSLRRMFVAREGYVMAKVDYASQELRITASVSGERKWIDEYVKEIETGIPADLHFMTAQAFYPGLKEDDPDFKLKRGAGKCVHPDTLLNTHKGYQAIQNVGPYSTKADTFLDLNTDHDYRPEADGNPVVATYNGGIKPLVHVVTRKGVVTCTEEHRFMLENGELVRAGDLQKGMELESASTPTMPRVGGSGRKTMALWKGVPPSSYRVAEKAAYFAGLFLGDGSVNASGSRITHGDVSKMDAFDTPYQEWQDALFDACEDLGLDPTREEKGLYLGSRVVVRYLEGLGLVVDRPDTENGRMKNLRVPDWVIEGGQEKFLPFLGGLIDTDGSVAHQRKTIEFTTKDFVFAGQIATLAQACGLQLSVEATYNKTYERHYARLKFTVASSWEMRKYLRYKGKVGRLGEQAGKSMMPTTNDVLAVLPAGEGPCLDITMGTEDHLYRANGMLTHNTANFALVYGGGVGAVQRATGCDAVEGGRLLKAFHESVPKFSKWVERQHDIVKAQLGVRTGFGRFISVPDANITADDIIARDLARQERAKEKDPSIQVKPMSKSAAWKDAKRIRAACERKSTNYPIQGSGADILKLSLVFLIKEFHLRGWLRNGGDDSVRLVMTVHDEIVFEIKHERVAEAIPVLKKIMEYPSTLAKWTVPLIAEPELGDSWNAKLDWISMLRGDKSHPVPEWLQGQEIVEDPEILVLSKTKKDGSKPTQEAPKPARKLEASAPPPDSEEAGSEADASTADADGSDDLGLDEEDLQGPEKVEEVPIPEKPATTHKQFAIFQLSSTFLTDDTVAGVSVAVATSKAEAHRREKMGDMVPVELLDAYGKILVSHKDGVLAYPPEFGRKLRETHLGREEYELEDV